MAVTSIWSVKGWLGKLVVYAENPDKTENPSYYEKQGMTAAQTQGLSDVIDYAAQTSKTKFTDETAEIQKHYVTGINCLVGSARDEMLATKEGFGKSGGVVAYHGIQSFAPSDFQAGLTPDMAHEIGVKLARRLWGGKYEVLVATHLDKGNHLHSHFIVNTVSCVDGSRYHRTEKDYYDMQVESDKLCHEYGLDVIKDPKRGRSKHYGEWRAEKEGRPTYRSMIRADVDQAVLESMTMQQLWNNLEKKGYHILFEQDIKLRGAGKDKGLKLVRNFGDDYSRESLAKRILANNRPQRIIIPPERTVTRIRFIGKLNQTKRITGLRALYFSYLYKMGAFPKKREPSPKQIYFLFREDIRYIRNISQETRLLVNKRIDTAEQLIAHKESLIDELASLSDTRKHLRYKTRSIHDDVKLSENKSQITALTTKIGELRKEVRLCEDIETRSVKMKENIRRANEDEKSKGKERQKHEPFRGRR